MDTQLQSILHSASTSAPTITNRPALEAFKAILVGPQGTLTAVVKALSSLPKEERPAMGKRINEVKQQVENLIHATEQRLEAAEALSMLGVPPDPTLPVAYPEGGTRHPLAQVCNTIVEIFRKIGFCRAAGSEVETEWYCFDALNTPEDHPARDAQDSFYFPKTTRFANISQHTNERYILRTQTSSVQIRWMLEHQPPIRIIAPGRVFRRDTVDATHSAHFHQIEGLYVDQNVTLRDLKAALDYFIRELFGTTAETRLRPSFFPFTEPSFEMDIRLQHFGKLSNQWIEVLGCGMVDPEVFKNVDYNSDSYSGYAFGMGVERMAMLLLGVDDIRYFYQNDWRFLNQFRKQEAACAVNH